MSCLTPLTLYHSDDSSTKKTRVVDEFPNAPNKKYTFNEEKGFSPISIPCGQCLGCRMDHSRDWALRCIHHSKQYTRNCFVTFTFSNENLKNRKSVDVRQFQLFMKRMRKKLTLENRPHVEYFHSTEYGEQRMRPHHHAILFNYYPPDAYPWEKKGPNIYYRSNELEELWQHQGHVVVGELTYDTAAYTAAYTFKKQRGKDYPEGISPEKMTCSQRIGVDYFLKYKDDYCSLGHIIHNEKKYRIPRRYLKELQIVDEKSYLNLKQKRAENARQDTILDRIKKYQFMIQIQKNYKKKLCNDTPLSEDNRYLKQLRSLQLQLIRLSGEYNPEKEQKLYEDVRRL